MTSENSTVSYAARFVFVLLTLALMVAPLSAIAETTKPAQPVWVTPGKITSDTGEHLLEWELPQGAVAELFELQEIFAGETTTSYVTGRSVNIRRIVPGVYTFRLSTCNRSDKGGLICGAQSRRLRFEVTEDVLAPLLEAMSEPEPEVGLAQPVSRAMPAGGPAEMRPGMWYDPSMPGHGWSFYWANRMAPSGGTDNAYDLYGIWYTYEAKTLVSEPGMPDEYWNHKPVVAIVKMVQLGQTNEFSGQVQINRNGQSPTHVGSATITFSANNTAATIQWSVNFKLQHLSGSDNIEFLLGDDASPFDDPTNYSGLWEPNSGADYYIIDNIGPSAETVEVVFEDNFGDPLWIQAESYVASTASTTQLCFYYITQGYAPNETGSISSNNYYSSGCDHTSTPSTSNRNGNRYFSDYEVGRYWVDFTLPSSAGSVSIGSSSNRAVFNKEANFHRVYSTNGNSCQIVSGGSSCDATLTWFTDSDYPDASVFAYNQTTGQRTLVGTSTDPIMEDQVATLSTEGTYTFELRMTSNSGSRMIAESADFVVTEVTTPATPTNLGASWTDQENCEFRVTWNHPDPASVDRYILNESVVSGSSMDIPVTSTFYDATGIAGTTYEYNVKACSSASGPEICSTETGTIQWDVPDPCLPDIEHPWKDNEHGTLYLDQPLQWVMGYIFSPAVDGQVEELGGFFDGTKVVKLWERYGPELASVTLASSNNWSYASISPVAVTAGTEYVVAVYVAGSGGTQRLGVNFPQQYDNINILGSTYESTSSDPDAIPTVLKSTVNYFGMVDIGFKATGSTLYPPEISPIDDQQNSEEDTATLQVVATDSDGTVVSFDDDDTLPPGLSIDDSGLISGVISAGAAAGSPYTVTITATDNDDLSDEEPFEWVVNASTGECTDIFFDDFETDKGWARDLEGTDTATKGLWERDNPASTTYNGLDYQLGTTPSGSYSLVTDNRAGANAYYYDVDGGLTTISSPEIALPAGGSGYLLEFDYNFAYRSDWSSTDRFSVYVVTGPTETKLFEIIDNNGIAAGQWKNEQFDLSGYAGETIRIRFEAEDDTAKGVLVEAQVDDFRICYEEPQDAPPTVTNPGDQLSHLNQDVSLQIEASDSIEDTLIYSALNLPPGLSINSASGLVSGTVQLNAAANSPYSVTVSVTDGTHITDVSFTWTITTDLVAFYDSFENGEWDGKWTQDAQNDWFITTVRATDGTHSAQFEGATTDAQLISIPIDLQGRSQATIGFDWYFEGDWELGEYVILDVSTDGGQSWQEQKRLRGAEDQEDTWFSEQLTLNGMASLRLRFRGTNSYVAEKGTVDNVLVTVPPLANSLPVVVNPGSQSNFTGDTISDLVIQVTDDDPYDTHTCTITGLPGGLSETAECVIGGTISAGVGNYTVTVIANDGTDDSSPVDFVWTVTAHTASPETPPGPAGPPSMTPTTGSSTVGTTAGQFRVDETGNANYSIPILTAPGSGGVVPQISLEYNSGSPNGIAGVGWSIGGLSTIVRCAQTAEQDPGSMVRGITFSSDDRFCLDGQRLLLVSQDKSYGENEAEYRTEIDSISRIVSHGSATSGPESFTVWRKDGSVSEYGSTTDSRIEAGLADDPATTTVDESDIAFVWAHKRFEDSAENYIVFHYDEYTGDYVEFVIDRISYTGNVNDHSPYAEIDFVYTNNRQDGTLSYLGGAALGQSKLLSRIDSKSKITASDSTYESLRSYVLSYDQDGDGYGRNILNSLKECSDSSESVCYQPTSFTWLKSVNTFPSGATSSFDLPDPLYALQLADINGDGRPDLLYTEESSNNFYLKIAQATAGGTFISLTGSYLLPEYSAYGGDRPVKVTPIDLNADGFQDIIYPNEDAYGAVRWHARLSTGSGLDGEIELAGTTTSMQSSVAQIMDFDGDGLSDIIQTRSIGADYEFVILTNTYSPGGQVGFQTPTEGIDLNVDGLFPDTAGWVKEDLLELSVGVLAHPRNTKVFDFNGDGATDILLQLTLGYCSPDCDGGAQAAALPTAQSTSTTFQIENLSADLLAGSVQAATPMEGDVTTQMVGDYATVSYWVLYESDRQGGLYRDQVVARGNYCDLQDICDYTYTDTPFVEEMRPLDVNGDGLADLVFEDKFSSAWQFQLNTGSEFLQTRDIGTPTSGVEDHIQFQDFNGDGLVDFLYPDQRDSDSAKWKVHTNNFGDAQVNFGDGSGGYPVAFSSGSLTQIPAPNTDHSDFTLFADFTGDAKLDQFLVDISSDGASAASEFSSGRNGETGISKEPKNVITQIVDGLDAVTLISYLPLTDSTVYTRMTDSKNANWGQGAVVYDIAAPVYVVSAVSSSAPLHNSANAKSSIEYHYVGAKLQGGGRGFLGFGEVISYDLQSGIRTNTRYRQDFPYIGMPYDTMQAAGASGSKFAHLSNTTATTPPSWGSVSATTAAPSSPGGTRISYAVNEWAIKPTAGNAIYPYIAHSLERSYTLSGAFDRKVLTQNQFDSYANLTSATVRTYDVDGSSAFATQSTSNTYDDVVNATTWYLGRLATSSVTHSRGSDSITRSSSFDYDSTTGILIQEIIEPGDSEFEIKTDYLLDSFGNRRKATVTGYGMTARSTTTSYDDLGRFVIQKKNALNQVTYNVSNGDWDVYGNPTLATNIDGIETQAAADYMGRPFVSYVETGAYTKTVNSTSTSNCPGGTAFKTTVTAGGKPTQFQCFDLLGRVIRTAVQTLDGTYAYTDQYYDSSGRVERISEPYFPGGSVYWNETGYDALGRITAILSAAGDDQQIDYDTSTACSSVSTRVVKTENALSQIRVELKNALGETVEVFDDACESITYDYDAVGNLAQVTGVDNEVITMSYDRAGRKIAMDDPDKGVWQYAYNPLGELTRQLDSKNQAIDFNYDSLGRIVSREELDNVSSLTDGSFDTVNTETTTYRGDSPGKGQPLEVRYRVGLAGAVVHQKSYLYDAYGRIQTVSTTIGTETFAEDTTYDQYGRVFQQFDASGDDHGLRYAYQNGHLKLIKEAREGTNGKVYQEILAMDARGNITNTDLGNGTNVLALYNEASGRLETLSAADAFGASRQDVDYLFDVLGNLKERHDRLSGTDGRWEQFTYDDLNRLTNVELSQDGGTNFSATLSLSYNAAGNITHKSDVGNYLYNATQPHAVSGIQGGTTYTYDANGNQETGDGRSITYTVFDKPDRISKGTAEVLFEYGVGNSRYQREDHENSVLQKTTLYVGSVERITEGGSTYFKRYLGGVAIATYYPSTGAQSLAYLLKDHICSIHSVLDEAGAVTATMHFDAFGQRQAPDWQTVLSYPTNLTELAWLNGITTRGFTGHEQVDSVGVIHMNGRIYDPKLGRFLQADPFVQVARNVQFLNRYTYALNNPLSYTDPSGYFLKELVRFAIAVVRVVMAERASPSAWLDLIHAGADLIRAITSNSNATMPGVLPGSFANSVSSTPIGRSNLEHKKREDDLLRQLHPVVAAIVNWTYSAETGGGFANGAAFAAFAAMFAEMGQFDTVFQEKLAATLSVLGQKPEGSPRDAALAGFDVVNPIAQNVEHEYGFAVYRIERQGYYFGMFITEHKRDIIENAPIAFTHVPDDATVVGYAHTQPDDANFGIADQLFVNPESIGPTLGWSDNASRLGQPGIFGWSAGPFGNVEEFSPWGDSLKLQRKVKY
jgi:RHS repeat-associated protein